MNQRTVVPHEAPIRGSQNLPVRPSEQLVGRDSDLTAVHLSLKAGAAVLLHGLPGNGKTALAAALASGYAELPGGVLWLEVANEALSSLLTRVARAYGMDTAGMDPDAQEKLVSGLLRQNRPLIVLDGQICVEQTRDFVRRCASGGPLLLTHARMVPGPWTPHAVNPLGQDDAETLLLRLSGLSHDAGAGDISRLSRALDGHPLSILVVARQLAAGEIGPGEFLARMSDLPSGDINRIMGILMVAYRALPASLQGLVLLAGSTFSGGASEELLAEVGGAPVHAIRSNLRQLVKRGFVSERSGHDQSYFSAHELVQTFAQIFLRGKKQLEAMQERHLRGALAYVRRHAEETGNVHYDCLAMEMPNLIAAAIFASRHGKDDFLTDLIALLEPVHATSFVTARGFRPELEWLKYLAAHPEAAEKPLLEMESVAVEVPSAEPETPAAEPAEMVQEQDTVQVQSLAKLGVEPLFEKSAPPKIVSKEIPAGRVETVPPSVAEAAPQEETAEPVSRYDQAVLDYQANGNVDDELAAIQALASLSLKQANYEDVLAYVDRGMALAQESDDPQREGHLLVVLGDMQAMLGRFEGAEVAYTEAISALRPTEAWLDIGLTLDKLGTLYLDMDRTEDAIAVWDQAVPIFEREQRSEELRSVLMKLGEAQIDSLHWDQALTYYTQALALVQAAGDTQGIFDQLSLIAELLESRGDWEGAAASYQRALGLALRLDDDEQVGETLLALGRLWVNDTVQLNRVVQLLKAADERLPGDSEVQRLLGRATARQERLTQAGVELLPPVAGLEDFAISLDGAV